MPVAFLDLFWLWTACSVGILVRRSVRKKRAKATRRRAELDAAMRRNAPPTAGADAAAIAPPPTPAWHPPQLPPAHQTAAGRHEVVDAEIVVEPEAATPPMSTLSAPAAGSEGDGPLALPPALASATEEPFVVEGEQSPPIASRDGAFAERGESSGIRTLVDVMAGFQMPCGLMPLIAQETL